MNILVVEDDAIIGKSVQKGLQESGHQCVLVRDGTAGFSAARTQKADVLVLDLMLPGLSGLQLLEQLRNEGIHTPVIILTALGAVEERVRGLSAGADDYVVKPFAIPELLARIDAVCRRTQTKPAPVLQIGPLTLDLPTRKVTCAEEEIELTPTEFSILEMLMRHAGQVVTRKMLCESLWESDWEGTTNVIEVHINRLRSKLQKATRDQLIHTVRGRGYAYRTPPH